MAGLGLAVSVLAFAGVEYIDRVKKQGEFEERAARRAELLQDAINVYVTLLRSIAGFYAASQFVSREEFSTFISTQPLAKFGDARLYWIPRVAAAQRATVEAEARADGFPDFHIWSAPPGAAGDSGGDDYYPVLYVELLQKNLDVLGHDFGTDPARRQLLERARDSGEPTATGRVTAIADSIQEPAVVIAMPIYKSKSIPENMAARRLDIAGFTAGTFRLRDLISASMLSDSPFGQDVYLYDESAIAPEPRLLYFSSSRLRSQPVEASREENVLADYHWMRIVDAPGREMAEK